MVRCSCPVVDEQVNRGGLGKVELKLVVGVERVADDHPDVFGPKHVAG